MSRELWRVVDANLNRIAEGLRVLEDVSRLVLDDAEVSRQLKELRHDLRKVEAGVQRRLLEARDAAGDVGADTVVAAQQKPRELYEVVAANARRVQEALRVMEEMGKTPELALDTEKFKHARFSLYGLEKEIIARLRERDK